MKNVEKLNVVIEFLQGKLDGLHSVKHYGNCASMIAEVNRQLREERAIRTVVVNMRSHKDIGSFLGEWAIKCNGRIEAVRPGDVIIDYEDGARDIFRKR